MPKDLAVSPNLIGLADDWEKDKSIRALVRANKGLLVWPSRKTTGVPSLAALALNHRLISYAAILWLPHNPKPKTLSVEMKNEVGFLFKNESHHASTFWSSESRSFNVHDFLNSQTPKRYVWYSIYKYFIFFIIYIYYIFWFWVYIIYIISPSPFLKSLSLELWLFLQGSLPAVDYGVVHHPESNSLWCACSQIPFHSTHSKTWW